MKIITVAHQKGGVGKTTLALNLAYCFKEGARVAIIDTDPQGSVSNIKPILEQHGIALIAPQDIDKVRNQYDIAVIDTPPYLSTTLPEFFKYSDFVLVPTKASVLDIMAIRATIKLLREAMKERPQLKASIVLNMVKSRSAITAEIKEILDEYKFPILNTMVSDRVSYTRSPISGGVFNTEDDKAKEEILGLTREIITQLK
ncbi:ParA family protein [Flectobacillus sp. DC10W]|uniref:ParA family protein n=1 Tax=Flectobacillus longus TaxID=2984207 RepID=A0ABT6YWT0_9BACT|nr:ParA family protein [Flectobacillus longus]MDI9867566.1 ParA family protein [Flectobacillus longus]